jgi:anti-sigma-K factor RskA
MTTDDDRIGYLAGEGGEDLDDVEAADLDELRALLADGSVWVEPDVRLEDAVVAAIASETGGQADQTAVEPRRRSRRLYAIGGAAAAAVLVVALVAVVISAGRTTQGRQLAASLAPTELAPAATGRATLTQTDSGWRVELDATGLPRLDGGRFYQAWLRNDEGILVSIGSFNEPEDVVLWAGVTPVEFRTLSVTEEVADGDPGSSGRRVLEGVAVDD